MLMPGLTTLPQHDYDLANVLFPEKHGKLPVNRIMYQEKLIRKLDLTERFLIEANESVVPTMLTWALCLCFGPVVSEMNTSARIVGFLVDLFHLCRSYSPQRTMGQSERWLRRCLGGPKLVAPEERRGSSLCRCLLGYLRS
jgi:hypothetical protein